MAITDDRPYGCHRRQDIFVVFVQIKINKAQLYTSHRNTILPRHLLIFVSQYDLKIKINILKPVLNGADGGESVGLYSHTQPLHRSQIMHF